MNTQTLDTILSGLLNRYRQRVPNVGRIIGLMIERELIGSADAIENDHIAFRTMGVPQLGIQSLEKIFLHCGYQRRDAYYFPNKHLDAFWYSPPALKYPRVFISQLRVGDMSPATQAVIHSYTNEVIADPVDALDLNDGEAVNQFLHRGLWRTPSWSNFEQLSNESEYASWVIYNRYYLNHFTISVHNLPPPYDNIEVFDQLLESNGVRLNDSGGKVKTSPDGLLRQSSTVAELVAAEFDDGHGRTIAKMIPGSYVEFAERRVLPEFADLPAAEVKHEHRRDGFEAGNADKIFESTYRDQVNPDT